MEVVETVVEVWGSDRVGVRLSPLSTFNDISDDEPEATFGHIADREAAWASHHGASGGRIYAPLLLADQASQRRRDVRLGKFPLLLWVLDEGEDVGELLTGEVDLLADQRLLHEDHGLGSAPHAGDEVERIDLARRELDVKRPRGGTAGLVDRVAGDAGLAHEQRPPARRIRTPMMRCASAPCAMPVPALASNTEPSTPRAIELKW
jgi:hypothetical protein